jgi:hypothetical protein
MSATVSFHHPTGTDRRAATVRTPHPARHSARPAARVSEATYRRRRAVVGTALAACVAVGAVTAYDVLAGSGSVPASAAVSQPARVTTVAGPGDSLWSIAERHHGDISISRYVDKLVQLNDGPTIQAGQLIVLP